jgi:chromosome segregation ATPase
MHEIDSMTPAEVSVSIRALQPGGSIYLKTLQPYTEIIQNIDIKIAHLRTELHKQQAKISIKQEKKSKTKQTLSQQKISETIKKLNTEISRLEHSKNKVTQYIANARQKMHIKSGELASDLRDHS